MFPRQLRWLTGCLFYLCTSCSNHADNIAPLVLTQADSLKENQRIKVAYEQITLLERKVKNGDLITRTGNDFTSESLRSLNQRNQTYSHCGIATIENDSVFVYHALGGEFNPDQKLLRERFSAFAAPEANRGIGIFRFSIDSSTIRNILFTVKELYRLPVTFDMKFDLNTEEKMYCAEFVAKSYQIGSKNALKFPFSRIKAFDFYGVDDIFLHPFCRSVQEIVYK